MVNNSKDTKKVCLIQKAWVADTNLLILNGCGHQQVDGMHSQKIPSETVLYILLLVESYATLQYSTPSQERLVVSRI